MPSYCILRKSTYYFQQIVPSDLVHIVGKKKIIFSLNTGNKRHAESLAKPLASQNKLLWNKLRQNELSEPLDPMWLNERCKEYIFEKIKSDAIQSQQWLNSIYQKHGKHFASSKKFEQVQNELQMNLLRSVQADPYFTFGAPEETPYSSIQKDYESFLNFYELNIKPNSAAFLHANRVLLNYLVAAQRIRTAQTEGDVIEEGSLFQKLFPTGSPTPTPKQQTITSLPAGSIAAVAAPETSSTHETAPRMSELFKAWKREHLKSGKTEDTVREYEGYLKRFIELIGDLAVHNVEPKHIREFKDALLSFPTYPKRYKIDSATDLIAMYKADSSIQTLSAKMAATLGGAEAEPSTVMDQFPLL